MDSVQTVEALSSKPGAERRSGSRHIWFLGAAFDRIGPDQALRRIAERNRWLPFQFVVTPNVDHLVRLSRGEARQAVLYAEAWLSVCDSRVLELIGKFSGEDIPVTPGSDLTASLFETEIDPDETVAVIGGSAETVEKLRARYGLTDLRWYDAPMGLRDNPAAVEACAEFAALNPARFTFVCVGSPQQEMVARAIKARGDCTGVGLCVGASLEFLTGETERAPVWMRRARLEWLHRLASEPQRLWRRYLVDGPKILKVWRSWRRQRARLEALRAETERRLRAAGLNIAAE